MSDWVVACLFNLRLTIVYNIHVVGRMLHWLTEKVGAPSFPFPKYYQVNEKPTQLALMMWL